jgi:RNA polymerase sigma-70 factor (ECF subfamily)
MHATSDSLLYRLRGNSESAWDRMEAIYTPMIRSWLGRYGIHSSDADDITQEVILVLLRKLPGFQRGRTGSFRSWMRHITVNCIREFRRRERRQVPGCTGDNALDLLSALEDPNSEPSRAWNEEHRRHLLTYALKKSKAGFTPQTWRAFQRTALEGKDHEDVARELGISVNAVYIAKSRVANRVRAIVRDLLD